MDKAKEELISKFPSPTNVKTVRQFLGHAGFYRRFIRDFSKIAKPLDRPKTRCVKCVPKCASARVAPSNIVY